MVRRRARERMGASMSEYITKNLSDIEDKIKRRNSLRKSDRESRSGENKGTTENRTERK